MRDVPASSHVERSRLEGLVDALAGRGGVEQARATTIEIGDVAAVLAGWNVRILFLLGDIDGALAQARQQECCIAVSADEFLRPGRESLRRHPGFAELVHARGTLRFWQELGWPAVCRPLEGDEFTFDAWSPEPPAGP